MCGSLETTFPLLVRRAGVFGQNLGIQQWLDMRRAQAPPGSQPLEALQRAAGLCGRLLRAFGREGARLLDCSGVAGGLAAALSLMARNGLTAAAAAPCMRAVCAALAQLLRISDEARRQLTAGARYQELTWEATAADVRQVGQSGRLASWCTAKHPVNGEAALADDWYMPWQLIWQPWWVPRNGVSTRLYVNPHS